MASITKNVVSTGSIKITMNISEKSYSVANNTSVVEYSIVLSGTGSLSVSNAKSLNVVINGTTVFNSTVNVTKSAGASKTLASGTTTVNHDNDGSKTVSYSFTQSFSGISWGGSGTFYSSVEGSGTLSLTTIPRASSISVSSGSATKPGNGSIVLSISRASSSFTHTVTWSCGNLNGTVGTGLATSASWSVPLSLIEQSPNGNQTVTFTCTTYNGSTSIGSHSCTATVGFHSPSTISSQSGNTLGSTMSFTIERSHQNLTHSLWYSFGSQTWQMIGSSLLTGASFTPPLSLCNEIPNATSGSMTIILRTYYGSTQIGSDQYKYYTMNVPASVIPSFTEISCVEAVNEVSTLVGAYVQNKSRLTLGSIGASGSYGSTIQSYKIEVAGQTIHSQSGTTNIITVNGSQKIIATISDTRGRTFTREMTIHILSYTNPKITGVHADRNTDTSALITASLVCSSLQVMSEEKNSLQYKIEYKSSFSSSYTVLTGEYDSLSQTLSRTLMNLDESQSYEILLYVGDVFGYNDAYEILRISTAFKAFDFDVKNGRLGIKKVLEHEDSIVEVPDDSKMYVGNNVINLNQIGKNYRIGDVIISISSENPSLQYGGEWELLCPGKTLICIDTQDSDFNTVEKTGGSKTVTLTSSQIPSHSHGLNGHTHSFQVTSETAGGHTPSGSISTKSLTGTFTAMRGGASGVFTQKSESSYTYGGTGTTREIVSMNASHNHTFTGDAVAAHSHKVSGTTAGNSNMTTSVGNNASHSNLQPYLVVYMWVKVA